MTLYNLYPQPVSTDQAKLSSIYSYRLVALVEAAGQWFVRRYKRHVAIGELSRLNDRMLRDIGVSRSDIPDLVEAALSAPAAVVTQRVAAAVQRPGGLDVPTADNDNHQRRLNALI